VALKEVGADVTLKTETTTSSQGTTADGDSIAIEAAAYRGGGQLVSDLKMQDSLDKILYELKLLRLYAQEEAGGRDLGVTIEELKNDDYK
tara:strand:+ start:31094 stop:31363 length:270 start_codon:yes stop_codon:yes gene_type:complete